VQVTLDSAPGLVCSGSDARLRGGQLGPHSPQLGVGPRVRDRSGGKLAAQRRMLARELVEFRARTGAPFCYVPASLGAIAPPRIITSAMRTR